MTASPPVSSLRLLTHTRRIVHAAFWLLCICCLLLCGCSSLQRLVRTSGEVAGVTVEQPVVELPPQVPPELLEVRREAATAVWQHLILSAVEHATDVYTPLMVRLQGLLVAAHGAPAHVPVTEPELLAVLAEGEELQAAHQGDLDTNDQERLEAATRPARRTWSLHSGALGNLLLWKCLAGSTALISVWALVKKGLLRLRAGGIVQSVGVLLDTLSPEHEVKAKKVLSAAQTGPVQKLVKALQ